MATGTQKTTGEGSGHIDAPSQNGDDPLSDLASRFGAVRRSTDDLTKALAPEDCVVQSMEDVSPTKWHLAHTSWFFEAFVLDPHLPGYEAFHPRYHYLFNSYYVQAGERHCRAQRGYLSRPTLAEVREFRAHVDDAVRALLERGGAEDPEVARLVELGMNHEQQHQELLLTDLKHVFSVNPLRPEYLEPSGYEGPGGARPLRWIDLEEGIYSIGYGGSGFHFDNEGPRHRRFLEPFAIADRLVTNEEYLAFMEDGGYGRPELWMAEGWAAREENEWTEPFYWERRGTEWWTFTLSGMQPVRPAEPVCHVTWFEADAFARWSGARLPREDEWEAAAEGRRIEGNLADTGRFHPTVADERAGDTARREPTQLFGDVWEWTSSAYSPYPGYRPEAGALGEYNGKFMCGQFVLRGGSCVTPSSHLRHTYRNFFHPDAAWQFSGIRLARDPA